MNTADLFSLRLQIGQQEPYTIALTNPSLVVGSAAEANLALVERYVSRRHFRLEISGGRIYVTDLGSENGTFLNGYRLPPHQPQEWRPGSVLTIAEHIRIELLTPVAPAQQAAGSQFTLTVAPIMLSASRPGTLSLTYGGGRSDQHVYFKARSLEGIDFDIQPGEQYITPGTTISATARLRTSKTFWLGGVFPVTFMSLTPDGEFAKAEARVRLRPRYAALLLILLLLFIPPAVLIVSRPNIPIIVQLPTATPTPTATDTPHPSRTPSATPTPREETTAEASATPTDEPSITPTTPVACVNQCAAFGWPNYVVQPGDTLFSLALAADVSMSQVQEVNCISDAGLIQAFQTICLPIIPQPRPQNTALRVTQSCDRASHTVTFTVFNDGPAAMPAPDTARIWDGFRNDLIAPAQFQLGVGQNRAFSFSYSSTPSYFGNILFFTAGGLSSVSTDCMPAEPPRVIVTTAAPPVVPQPILSVAGQCSVVDTCGDGCLEYRANFTVSNSGGAMSSALAYNMTVPGATVQSGTFQLGSGQNQTLTHVYPDEDSPSPVNFSAPGLSSSLGCLPPRASITAPFTFCATASDQCQASDGDPASYRVITFTGEGTDPENGVLSGASLQWSISGPDLTGSYTPAGTGTSVTLRLDLLDSTCEFYAGLGGTFYQTGYGIELRATDSSGMTGTDSAYIVVWQYCGTSVPIP
ncbi:MAG: FHA domain-containing protein [Chloroflexi bacterium]|nr:FHA domain-containing protein [Chloroflexota bacterium]